MLYKNGKGNPKFVLKAPKNSTLVLLKDGEVLKDVHTTGEPSGCDHTPLVHQSSTDIDDFYSLFTAEVKVY